MGLLGKFVAAGLVASGALVVPASAGATAAPPALTGATDPSLTGYGAGGLLLLADRAAPAGATNTALLARGGHAAKGTTTWGHVVRLGTVSTFGVRDVALNPRGVGAVLWSKAVGQGGRTYLRLRHADGTWAASHLIPHAGFNYAGMASVAVNAKGVVAAVTTRGYGKSFVTLHRPGHRWQRIALPGALLNPDTVRVDARGGLHLVETTVPRGGDGWVVVAYRSPKGHWTSGRVKAGSMVENGQLAVAPSGAETLVVGQASRQWLSTLDTEYYWPTQYSVFRRTSPTGRWHKTWHRAGATAMQIATSGGQVRMTWTQYADPNAQRAPQKLLLQSRGVAAGSTLTTLDTQATDVHGTDWDADFLSATAIGAGCRVQAWRVDAAGSTTGSALTSLVAGQRASYADGTTARYDLEAATACTTTGHAYLARTIHQRISTDEGGQYVTGGDVVVTRLR